MSHRQAAFAVALVWSAVVYGGEFGLSQVPATSSKPEQAQVCRDSQGGAYSPGALVEIDGKKVQCVINPHWVPAGSDAPESVTDVLDVGDRNLAAAHEAAILAALTKGPLPTLECDVVLNSTAVDQELTQVPIGQKRVMMFWTPTCGPCKPLLADLAALVDKKRHGLSVLGIVQSVDSDLEPPGDWALLRVKHLLATYKVSFPTCVHTSRAQMKRWHAQGVPLTLLLSHDGLERVAAGGRNGQRLVAELAGTPVK